jgi:hypothetical protein
MESKLKDTGVSLLKPSLTITDHSRLKPAQAETRLRIRWNLVLGKSRSWRSISHFMKNHALKVIVGRIGVVWTSVDCFEDYKVTLLRKGRYLPIVMSLFYFSVSINLTDSHCYSQKELAFENSITNLQRQLWSIHSPITIGTQLLTWWLIQCILPKLLQCFMWPIKRP